MMINWTISWLFTLFFISGACSLVINDRQNGEWVSKLLHSTVDDYLLTAMGDTQFWYQCTTTNTPCKAMTQNLRTDYGADIHCEVSAQAAAAHGLDDSKREIIKQWCRQIENNFANDIQSSVVKSLINLLQPVHQPRALLYVGDLTCHGYKEELTAFENVWINPFDLRLYPGLGNHDMEVNSHCTDYTCVSRMLHWLMDFAKKNGIQLDYMETMVNGRRTYTGSFGYSTTLCTHSGKQCSRLIQLNNLPDFAASFTSSYSHWEITSPVNFLRNELQQAKFNGETVFIMSHHLGNNDEIIPSLVKSLSMTNRVIILRAHDHNLDEVHTKCGYKTLIPIIYTGSVPKNRFCVVRMLPDHTHHIEIFHLAANPDKSATILHYQNFDFDDC